MGRPGDLISLCLQSSEGVNAYVDMSRHITLNTGICIDQPGAANVNACFQDCVIDKVLELRVLVLQLVRKYEAGEPSADGDDFQLAGVCPGRGVSC